MAFYPGMGLVVMGQPSGGYGSTGAMMMIGGHPGMVMMGPGGPLLLPGGHGGRVMMGHPGMMMMHGGGHPALAMAHHEHPALMMAHHGAAARHPFGAHVSFRHPCGNMMAPRFNVCCDMCGGSADDGVGCSRCQEDVCRRCLEKYLRNKKDDDRPSPARALGGGDAAQGTHRYTAMGMMQHQGYPVQRVNIDGVTWYRKTWPSDMAAQCLAGWRRCEKIGDVIPDIKPCTDSPRALLVKGGTLLARFVKQPYTSSTRAKLLASIDELHAKLIAAQVAHCDVKPENAVVDEASCRILLIDADFATRFGRQRPAWTPGVNGNGAEQCGAHTDRMGFDALRAALR